MISRRNSGGRESRTGVVSAFTAHAGLSASLNTAVISKCAELSAAIYNPHSPLCRLGVRIEDQRTDTLCVVLDDGDSTCVVFRGTESVRNAIVDAEALVDPYGRHLGFATAWRGVQARVISNIALRAGKPLIITGHSLGGALAVLCAQNFERSTLITFGQPRTLIRSRAQQLAKSCVVWIRVVNDLDIVARLPVWPFWHEGTLLQFGPRGGVHLNPGPHKRAVWFLRGLLHKWDEQFRDHHVANYSRLSELL